MPNPKKRVRVPVKKKKAKWRDPSIPPPITIKDDRWPRCYAEDVGRWVSVYEAVDVGFVGDTDKRARGKEYAKNVKALQKKYADGKGDLQKEFVPPKRPKKKLLIVPKGAKKKAPKKTVKKKVMTQKRWDSKFTGDLKLVKKAPPKGRKPAKKKRRR